MTETIKILIIDDEKVIRDGCERALASEGYEIHKAEDGGKGIERLKSESFDVVLLDLMMPGIDGFGVLSWIGEHKLSIPVIVITGFATVPKAVTAMKHGAFDFVGKPFTPDYIRIVVSRAVQKRNLERETERLREEKFHDLMTITEEKSRLKTVFRGMLDGVLITDNEMMVVHSNPAAVRSLQIQTDPVVGKKLEISIADKRLIEMVREAIEHGKSSTREFVPGEISRSYMRAHCSPVPGTSGDILGSVTLFQDITTQKEIDRQKSEFVSMVVHELRAPLASVEQMIYAMAAGCDDIEGSPCERLHERMTARTKELMQLIANLLSLSKLESESLVLNRETLEGSELIRDVIEVLTPQAGQKGISLEYVSANEKWWFDGDYDYIRSAFINVVGNAIKYTPDGGSVNISVKSAQELVSIRISDTGIGIDKEDLPNIFDRFFRVKDRQTRRITGSGLGLSVVKKIVEGHNGYIDVESEHGQGSTFIISFPSSSQP